jgi:xanthosine utilization system XapX-like protein
MAMSIVTTAQAPTPPPVAAEPASGPLSQEHLAELARAEQRARKVRKAGGVAMFNGCTVGFFAAASLLFAAVSPLFGELDIEALIMAAGLGVVAWNEFRGRRLIRRLDLRACPLLGWNQLGLMALLIGYCAWQIARALFGANPYADAISREPMLASMLGPLGDLYKTLTVAAYAAVIVGTAVFQGLNALYYFTRRKHLLAYLNETPPWVVDLQRASTGP